MERPPSIKDRMGIDIGVKMPISEAIVWAAMHAVRRIETDPDFQGHYMCAFGALDVMLAQQA